MQSYIISAFVLVLVACTVLGQDNLYGKYERACVQAGGMCMKKEQCRIDNFVQKGGHLCPQQEAQGYECCFGLPTGENRCHHLGGECMSECSHSFLELEGATDCDAKCCRITM